MNYEAIFATVAGYVGTLLLTGIIFYFKGYRHAIMERVKEILKEEGKEDKE